MASPPCLGGNGLEKLKNLLLYPNPITADDEGLHVVFEEKNLLAASGSALTWMVSDGWDASAWEHIEREKEPLTTYCQRYAGSGDLHPHPAMGCPKRMNPTIPTAGHGLL